MAVQESIAPAISEAMISAAHRLDTRPEPRRRRWAGPLGLTLMAAAAATAAVAVAMRRRPVMVSYPAPDMDPGEMTSSSGMPGGHLADADGSQPDTEVNGQSRET
jgi:ferric-dicitrate binding protein FerR (iron transport regulator)